MHQLELDRQKFEQKMENDRKAFELELSKINQVALERNEKATRQNENATRKLTWWLGLVALFLALGEIAAGLLPLGFPSGAHWLMEYFGTLPVEPKLPPMPPM